MRQLALNYPPIWIERRLSRQHLAFSGRFRWKILPYIAVKLGFGISYLPEVQVSMSGKDGEIIARARSDEEIEENLLTFLRSARSAKSLEIRNSITALDYSAVSLFRKISRLSIFGPISKPIDLSACHQLEALVVNHRSASKIRGLSNLVRLKEIHVRQVTLDWLAQVPDSLQTLYLSGSLPQSIDLARLEKLETIVLRKMNLLTFESFSFASSSAPYLVIDDVKDVAGLDCLSKSFPKLQVVSVKGNSAPWLEKLKQSSGGKFEIIS